MAEPVAAPDEPKVSPAPAEPPRPHGGGSGGIPPLVTWTLASIGVWLIYTSIRGLSPLAEFKAALTKQPSPGATTLALAQTDIVTGYQDRGADTPAAVAQNTAHDPPQLVDIGGGKKLAPDAAIGFATWQNVYGAPIPLTDAYRSYAQQAAGHQGNPERFADPARSWHVKGEAVDVNWKTLGAVVPDKDGNGGNAVWQRLYAAARTAGWCNPRGADAKQGARDEYWHFSYGGCG